MSNIERRELQASEGPVPYDVVHYHHPYQGEQIYFVYLQDKTYFLSMTFGLSNALLAVVPENMEAKTDGTFPRLRTRI